VSIDEICREIAAGRFDRARTLVEEYTKAAVASGSPAALAHARQSIKKALRLARGVRAADLTKLARCRAAEPYHAKDEQPVSIFDLYG
jgi:hypothetical protein